MTTIYYDSRTGNVERFINRVRLLTDWDCIKIVEDLTIEAPGHLVTHTTKIGCVPQLTTNFMKRNGMCILSVSSSGNMNWGANYGLAGDKIAELYNIPLLLKFELSGLDSDVNNFILNVKSYANKEMDTPQ